MATVEEMFSRASTVNLTTESLSRYAGTSVTFAEFSNYYESRLEGDIDFGLKVFLRRCLFNELNYFGALKGGDSYEKAKVDIDALIKAASFKRHLPLFRNHFSKVDFKSLAKEGT